MSDNLHSSDALTQEIRKNGIHNWDVLLSYIHSLPYGRNSNRTDVSLVLKEGKGSCSSKHGLLKTLADLNNISAVQLMLGMYKMNADNTPGIGDALAASKLDYIPEAHCYLKIDGVRADFTSAQSNITLIEKSLLKEMEIQPSQIADFKVKWHKDYVRQWVLDENLELNFEQVWQIREDCIEHLSENSTAIKK